MLIVENLRKEFKNVVAVDNISFAINQGQIFGLLGPNGAGKTTAIRTILNILKPDSGKILFRGTPVSKNLFSKVGYLPEERGLYKKSRVKDVISYLAMMKEMPPAKIDRALTIWLQKLNIQDMKNRKIEELSKGNQQKVQFISAVIHNPDLVVLDEPFSGFDPINQEIIRDYIINLRNEGKIIVLSTHQMDTAEKLCSEILLINEGREVIKGNLSEIKQKFGGNFVKIGFSGDPAVFTDHVLIEHCNIFNGYAELQLTNEAHHSLFLQDISRKLDIHHFSVIEPTLHKIFIDSVKDSSRNA